MYFLYKLYNNLLFWIILFVILHLCYEGVDGGEEGGQQVEEP